MMIWQLRKPYFHGAGICKITGDDGPTEVAVDSEGYFETPHDAETLPKNSILYVFAYHIPDGVRPDEGAAASLVPNTPMQQGIDKPTFETQPRSLPDR